MNQLSLPASDLGTGQWTPVPIFSHVNQGECVQSDGVTQGDGFTVKMANLAWPKPGTVRATVNLSKTEAGDLPVQILLLQDTQVLAYDTVSPTESSADYDLEVEQTETGPITDFHALRVRVSVGNPTVPCCGSALSKLLLATIDWPECSCGHGGQILLSWNSAESRWEGAGPFGNCSSRLRIQVFCQGNSISGLVLLHDGCAGGSFSSAGQLAGATCSPLSATYQSVPASACCGSGPTTPWRIHIAEVFS